MGRVRGRRGGWTKKGGWKTSRMTPLPKKGFWTPPPPLIRYVFHPLRCQCSVSPVQKSTTEQTRSSFFWRGPKIFGRARAMYVFLPPYVLHPAQEGGGVNIFFRGRNVHQEKNPVNPYPLNYKMFAIQKKILRGINFVKITKNIFQR